jgi:hypothetical protein
MPAVTTTIIYRIDSPDLVKAAGIIVMWPTIGLFACVFVVCMFWEDLSKAKPKSESKSQIIGKDDVCQCKIRVSRSADQDSFMCAGLSYPGY